MTNLATRFVGLAFPVVKVRYHGPTDHRGARYVATLRGIRVTRVTRSFDYALNPSEQARLAAVECAEKYRRENGRDDAYVLIPGDLDESHYCFTIVPAYFFEKGN